MITGGRKGIQSCLTWASDLTIKIELNEETETEREEMLAEMGEKIRIKGEGYIATMESERIDQVLTRPGSIRDHRGRLSQWPCDEVGGSWLGVGWGGTVAARAAGVGRWLVDYDSVSCLLAQPSASQPFPS